MLDLNSLPISINTAYYMLPESKSKSIYLNKSLDTQVSRDTDACPTKENNPTMKHTSVRFSVIFKNV